MLRDDGSVVRTDDSTQRVRTTVMSSARTMEMSSARATEPSSVRTTEPSTEPSSVRTTEKQIKKIKQSDAGVMTYMYFGPSGLPLAFFRRRVTRRVGTAQIYKIQVFWAVWRGPSPTYGALPTGSRPVPGSLPQAFPEPWQPTAPTYWTKPHCNPLVGALGDWESLSSPL